MGDDVRPQEPQPFARHLRQAVTAVLKAEKVAELVPSRKTSPLSTLMSVLPRTSCTLYRYRGLRVALRYCA
jgi:hypothetical protein